MAHNDADDPYGSGEAEQGGREEGEGVDGEDVAAHGGGAKDDEVDVADLSVLAVAVRGEDAVEGDEDAVGADGEVGDCGRSCPSTGRGSRRR